MLDFHTSPPHEATRSAFRLLRTPAKGKLQLLITCDQLLGCFTHFFAGRTTPCTGEACEACHAGASARWHGYVSAIEQKTNEQVVFECTAAAAEAFGAYRAKHGTLRGCDCIASRVAPRPNARVRLQMRPLDLTGRDLPKPINLRLALCHIWGIPANETNVSDSPDAQHTITHTGTALPRDPGQAPGNGRATAQPAAKPE